MKAVKVNETPPKIFYITARAPSGEGRRVSAAGVIRPPRGLNG
nr:MAG TPA: hypothetical protein [Caudoviricetes sp.]